MGGASLEDAVSVSRRMTSPYQCQYSLLGMSCMRVV